MEALTITPLPVSFGAVVTGQRLAQLDDGGFEQLLDAFHRYAVLVLPKQHLTDDEQIAFGRRFGPLETIAGREGLSIVSNVSRDGELLPEDSPLLGILRGNEGWHTDSSYMPVSAKASILSARTIPTSGGETQWADMRAAYDALPNDVRVRVDGLSAYHSLVRSQRRAGFDAPIGTFYGYHDEDPLRPLVKVHPMTGRKSLFIGRHAYGIPGETEESSKHLLDWLLTFACQPPRLHTHRWQPGDVVVWDNRCVLHRARPYDADEPRVMVHTRVSGDPATEGAPTTRVAAG